MRLLASDGEILAQSTAAELDKLRAQWIERGHSPDSFELHPEQTGKTHLLGTVESKWRELRDQYNVGSNEAVSIAKSVGLEPYLPDYQLTHVEIVEVPREEVVAASAWAIGLIVGWVLLFVVVPILLYRMVEEAGGSGVVFILLCMFTVIGGLIYLWVVQANHRNVKQHRHDVSLQRRMDRLHNQRQIDAAVGNPPGQRVNLPQPRDRRRQ